MNTGRGEERYAGTSAGIPIEWAKFDGGGDTASAWEEVCLCIVGNGGQGTREPQRERGDLEEYGYRCSKKSYEPHLAILVYGTRGKYLESLIPRMGFL